MKILFVTTIFNQAITGAGRFAHVVAEMTKSYPDCEVRVLSEQVKVSHGIPVKISKPAKWPVVSFYFRSRDYARAIRDTLKNESFDLIFFNDAWLAYHHIRMSAVVIPACVFLHDDNGINARLFSGLKVRQQMEGMVLKRVNCILTNSSYLANAIAENYAISLSKITVLQLSFIDYKVIISDLLSIECYESIRILFVKNDYTNGGLRLLIQALIELCEYQFSLTVIGPPRDVVIRQFSNLINSGSNIQWQVMGRCPEHKEVLDQMQQHHIFCVPSAREAFGVGNLEALASGMRVVYWQTGGVPQELKSYAYHIKKRDIHGIADALRMAITEDEPTTKHRIDQGRKWVRDSLKLSTLQKDLYNSFKGQINGTR